MDIFKTCWYLHIFSCSTGVPAFHFSKTVDSTFATAQCSCTRDLGSISLSVQYYEAVEEERLQTAGGQTLQFYWQTADYTSAGPVNKSRLTVCLTTFP